MPYAPSKLNLSVISPWRVFFLVMSLVFAVELGIMLLISLFEPFPGGPYSRAVIDAVALTAVLSPAVWFLVLRPLRALFDQRGRLLSRVFEVQEQERAKLSRDLHDELGQQLTAVLLGLRAVEQAPDIQHARERAQTVGQIAAASMESVRRLARGLRPLVLADLGLRPAVERLCEDVSRSSGMPITLRIELSDRRLPAATEIAVYRVLQEALTNVVRHAQATEARVSLVLERGDLLLEVSDNGRASLPPRPETSTPSGLGVQGMRERVSSLNGEFRVDWGSATRQGTTIGVRIPKVTSGNEPHESTDRG